MNTATDTQENIRSAIEQLLCAMCEQPQAASVRLLPSTRKPALILACHRMDFGAVLGKSGTMLAAIKTLAAAMGHRHGIDVQVILDEDGCTGDATPRRRYEHDQQWDPEPFEKLATLFCAELCDCTVTLEPASHTTSKLTVTVTGDTIDGEAIAIEKALEMAFSCVGVVQGRRILVELIN